MNPEDLHTLPCPRCNRDTDSLKQLRMIDTIVALPFAAMSTSVVVRGCPKCVRIYIWKRCRENGLTTWIVGYAILIPYSLGLHLATISKGHSWPVQRGITPEMHLNRTWVHEASFLDKFLAAFAMPVALAPGVGILICWWILWKVRWCTGWVYKSAEIASFVAYFVTVIGIFMTIERLWGKPH